MYWEISSTHTTTDDKDEGSWQYRIFLGQVRYAWRIPSYYGTFGEGLNISHGFTTTLGDVIYLEIRGNSNSNVSDDLIGILNLD